MGVHAPPTWRMTDHLAVRDWLPMTQSMDTVSPWVHRLRHSMLCVTPQSSMRVWGMEYTTSPHRLPSRTAAVAHASHWPRQHTRTMEAHQSRPPEPLSTSPFQDHVET